MAGFDVDKMFNDAKNAIKEFALSHPNEHFYAFSIDASGLCLNSEEQFKLTLNHYQEQYPSHYSDEKSILGLKYNTGDWEYLSFFDLDDGFDHEAYDNHYHIPFEHSEIDELELNKLFNSSEYHIAMTALLNRLIHEKCFDTLNTTSDFKAFLSEHEY